MKYEFHVGDYVETKTGTVGFVSNVPEDNLASWVPTKLSTADACEELYVVGDSYNIPFPVFHTYNIFKRIGQYDFTKLETKRIEKLPVDLVARFEIPDGGYITSKTWNNNDEFVETFYSRELVNKINELVEAVNKLEG